MKTKKYKAIVLDLDGTTIPNSIEGMPSENVTAAIKKASKLIHVGIATSRPRLWTTHITKHLNLTSPCIVDGGAQIIDPQTNKILWEQPIDKQDVERIFDVAKEMNITMNISDGDSHDITDKKEIKNKVFDVFFKTLSDAQSDKLIDTISQISSISIHRMPPWGGGVPPVVVTHASATKQHGILKVAEMLRIETHDIIGVGDGYNDFPLLMACGLKVAMGNAVQELKEIADYIAPSVEDDGVADVIEKFVIKD
jgi:HAD superfamily hydrolase (TIGR01484 family)